MLPGPPMKFEHQIDIDAPAADVRAFLDDFERAAKCLPGVEEVRALGGDEYEGRVRVKVGPLGFNLGGKARLEKKEGLDGWIAHGEGRDSKVGAGVKASLEARIAERGPKATQVLVSADVQFSGRLAGLGQPLIKHKADSMVREFAENVRREISATQ